MDRMSSVAMRETGVMSPAVCPEEPTVLQLGFGVLAPESILGGDLPAGFSVLRNAAGI